MSVKGFVLHATYRIHIGRAVIYLFGRLVDGRTFLIQDDRQIPYFYVRQRDQKKLDFKQIQIRESNWRTLDGYDTVRIECRLPSDVANMRRHLEKQAIDTYQADVRFTTEYLIDKDIRGGCVIDGTEESGTPHIDVIFKNPEVRSAEVDFSPSTLSVDIETDPKVERLLAISLYGPMIDEVLIVDPTARRLPPRTRAFSTQKELIGAFVETILKHDPDVLTGWNLIDFDLTILDRLAEQEKVKFHIGRISERIRIRKAVGYFGSGNADIPGRVVLDGMDLVRGAFMRFPDFSLDTVAQEVLGEGKELEGEVGDRAAEIMWNYENDLEAFVSYSRTDARLAYQIVDKLKLIPLAVRRSQLTGMTMDRVAASIASFDFVYRAALNQRRICAPSVGAGDLHHSERHHGGHVLQPEVGIHPNVWIFDFKSLYPSVIRTFNIDPLTFATSTRGDYLEVTDGVRFSREQGPLPKILGELFDERELAKERQDGVASQAIKILMNSFYGVLTTPQCRFHNGKIGNAITGTARHILNWSKNWFESQDYDVLYGDTDSLFVASGIDDKAVALSQGVAIGSELNQQLNRYIEAQWRLESYLELEFEKLYTKLFLLPLRRGTGGARKRYAGVRYDGELEFIGMEVVRRDWTNLAKNVQRELYRRMFEGQPVIDYLQNVVDKVRSGDLDADLVYRKGLSRDPSQYKKALPPHVVAALKSPSKDRIVRYVITVGGPEPLDNLQHDIDREHYIAKQIRAVALPVMQTLGLDFDADIKNPDKYPLFDGLDL